MIIISLAVFVGYFVLGLLSRYEQVSEETEKILRPFCRMATFLYKRVCQYNITLFTSRQVEMDLERLHTGERREQLKTVYYERKLALCLLIGLIGTGVALVADRQSLANTLLTKTETVVRNNYSEGEQNLEIEASTNNREIGSFQVSVLPRVLTKEETETLYGEFLVELSEYILNGNPSLEEVYGDMQLPEMMEEYPFIIEWSTNAPGVIGTSGTLFSTEDETQEIVLTAKISYEDMQWEELFRIRVIQPPMSAEEREYRELQRLLAESEESSRAEKEWKLPEIWQEEELKWKQVQENYGYLLLGISFLTAAAVFLLSDWDLHEKLEKKKTGMKQEYPDIVHKLALYFGAGMTVRGAFQRIAGDYEQTKKEGGEKKAAYEEMLYTCRELQAGVSEGAAYEHFGRRTGLQEYIRLSTFLMQNLKKGNSALLARLKEEAAKTYNERIQNGRRLGEEAVTKLLLPMIMMLVVVMIMVMLPAFSAMGV